MHVKNVHTISGMERHGVAWAALCFPFTLHTSLSTGGGHFYVCQQSHVGKNAYQNVAGRQHVGRSSAFFMDILTANDLILLALMYRRVKRI